jgi:hypothetical protein
MGERKNTLVLESADELWRPGTRREFLRLLGIGGAVVMLPSVFAACDDDDDPTGNGGNNDQPVTLNLSNDIGILNYAYALEQLEAAFYTAVLASAAFNGLSVEEKEVMTDLRNHEVIHREYFRNALGTTNRIRDLATNPTTVAAVTLNRDIILKTAEMFEDLGVAAYNGAGKYLTSAEFLTVAGKIVSVEARHAAAIRDMRDALGILGGDADNTRFAGDTVVRPPSDTAFQGLDVKLEPAQVIAAVGATNILATSSAVSIGTQPATKAGTPNFAPPSPTP